MKTIKEKHATELDGKFYEDRKILYAVEFPAGDTFEAISAAEVYLKDLGYTTGSMARNEPIGFAYESDHIEKWYNLSDNDKKSLDGLILANNDFREGGAIILFFTPPKF